MQAGCRICSELGIDKTLFETHQPTEVALKAAEKAEAQMPRFTWLWSALQTIMSRVRLSRSFASKGSDRTPDTHQIPQACKATVKSKKRPRLQ